MYLLTPELRAEIQAHNRAVILDSLKALGITRVTIEYNGCGDSGDVTDAGTEPADAVEHLKETAVVVACINYDHGAPQDTRYSRQDCSTSLREALDHFALDWASMQHPGWENNDGGRGEFTVFVNEGRFELEHYEYYTESSHYAYELP